MDNIAFIKLIAPLIQKQCILRGYMFPSAIIAQACLESNYGESRLSKEYHNYFGIKAGAAWRGRRVNFKTMEEYKPGTLTQINDDFRAYDDIKTGVCGYFEFLEKNSRYSGLKSATSPRDYLERIKAAGYATSKQYVSNIDTLRELMKLDKYDYRGELLTALDTIADYYIKGFFDSGDARKDNVYSITQAWCNKKLAEG